MFIKQMLNQTNVPVLERLLEFTSARHNLIADNIANVDTPGYRQKDMSIDKFYGLMQRRVAKQDQNPGAEVNFDDIDSEITHPNTGILFHDGNNRSMEQLQTDLAKNGILHNMVIELLRNQFQGMEAALKEKVS